MASKRLLRLKYGRTEVGFLSACVAEDAAEVPFWSLRVESPSSTDDFRGHLHEGSSMALSMFTGDGDQLRGEAYVSSISDGMDSATVVVLAGTGPLRRV
jgi:hypothetical protein